VSTEERPDSLAAQAASWVPPWERPQRRDPAYRAEAAEPEIPGDTGDTDRDEKPVPDDDEERSVASLSDDDDDFDESFEGPNPEGYEEGVTPELAPLPAEADGAEADGKATVDAPAERPDEREPEPTDVGGVPEVPPSPPLEEAEVPPQPERAAAVDDPVLPDGGDAGGMFDAAADDDLSAEEDVELPITAVVPAQEGDDEPRAQSRPEAPPEPGSPSGGAAVGAPDARTEDDDRARADPAPADQADRDAAPAGAAAEAAGDAEPMADDELRAGLEAILLVVDEPVAEMQLAQIMEQPTERVAAMLEDISARYTAAGHGFDLRRAAGGWRLYTRPEYAPYVERFVLDGQSVRLTQASLETLAVVAYKQPVTRSRVSAIRGVNCDGVMRTLVTRGLIEECGIERETGAYLYRTTPLFLEKLGLNSVDQLPPLAPFLPDDVEEVPDVSG
jgi:segregation and condensation protein B